MRIILIRDYILITAPCQSEPSAAAPWTAVAALDFT
jgi:hypothetical protein